MSILFVVAQCNLFNFRLDVASQITGALCTPLKSQDAACLLRTGREQEWGFSGVAAARAMTSLVGITFHLLCQSVKGLVVNPAPESRPRQEELRSVLD